MRLATIEEKFKKVESCFEEDNVGELWELFVQKVQNIEDYIDEVDDLVADTNEVFKTDNKIPEKILSEISKSAKELLKKLHDQLSDMRKHHEFARTMNQIAPKLIMKYENVIGELEDTIENIDLFLAFREEFDQMSPLAKEYAKKAPVLDLNKKIKKTRVR